MTSAEPGYRAAERQIELGTLLVGAVGAIVAVLVWSWPAAGGVLVGAVLAWLNFRWLKQGVAALERVSVAQADAETVRIPKRTYVKFFGRYVLLLGILYVIFSRSLLPVAAVFVGLMALVAAALSAMVVTLFRHPEP
ncbi:MAG: ATP synthase subunit I [Firmicutes bacterium]|nr:ATP synthase subunit I [Bacillota bacterium]